MFFRYLNSYAREEIIRTPPNNGQESTLHETKIWIKARSSLRGLIQESLLGFREHVSASRQDPNGGFLALAPVFSELLFFRYIKTPHSPFTRNHGKPKKRNVMRSNTQEYPRVSFAYNLES